MRAPPVRKKPLLVLGGVAAVLAAGHLAFCGLSPSTTYGLKEPTLLMSGA